MSSLYEVSSFIALVMSRANNFAQILKILTKGTRIDVLSISGNWAYFKYNNQNSYVKKNNLKIINTPPTEVKGSIILKYLDINTKAEVYSSETINNLSLGSYTYEPKSIYGYKLTTASPQSITLTQANPNQEVVFYYDKILGSITIQYVDNVTNNEIYDSTVINNLSLGSYTYGFVYVSNYLLDDDETKTVTLTEATPNVTISFKYKEILGSVTIEYLDSISSVELAPKKEFLNLTLGTYSYTALSLPGYSLVGDPTKSVILSDTNLNSTIIFTYKEILGTVNIKYIDSTTNSEIASSESYSDLKLGDYTYEAKTISGYTLIGNSSETVTLSDTNTIISVIFNYEEILGSITVSYVDESNNKIADDKINSKLKLGSYTYTAVDISGYSITNSSTQSVILTSDIPNQSISFKYSKIVSDLYVIELKKFNIFNDNTHAEETTKGINDALIYAKQQGFKKIQLPSGNYLIENDTIQMTKKLIDILDNTKSWSFDVRGILIPDNIIFLAENCIFNLKPNKLSGQGVINFAGSNNAQLIGGTIIGDRDTHLFELVINRNADQLESGDFDITTGLPIEDTTKMRTKNYISSIDDGSNLPTSFVICPLANTSMNTVDGGCRYIYCYDKDNNYLGKATGDNSFLTRVTLPTNTAKIKISFRGEKRADAKYYLSTEKVYITFEQCYGIRIFSGDNITLQNVTSNNFLSDGAATMGIPINHTINNLNILNCTFENNRRQGMSFVGTTEGCLLKDCKFGKTQGVDPQCGIDFEHYTYVKNIVIDNCDFYDNKKWDIINYNGWNIEIKNSRFNGAIASTYGYNMNLHNNNFKYSDAIWLDKSYKGTLFSLNTNKTNADGAYFKIDNNIIDGYSSAGCSSSLTNSSFIGNIVNNSNFIVGTNASDNSYTNCTVRYSARGYKYTNEKLLNSILSGENNGNNTTDRFYDKFELINCDFKGGSPTIPNTLFTNCKVYNNTIPFCGTWGGKYTLDNCTITTEYTSNIPFISSQGCKDVTFTNCIMNLSVTRFIALNYNTFYMNNCTITFNEFYNSQETIQFYRNVYGSATFNSNKFYKNCTYPKITLPISINSYANNTSFTNSITI